MAIDHAPIDFYFDFASPYAYLASARIDDLAARYDRTVRWRPMMLGPAMKVTGGRPLAEIPMRGAYLRHDVPRFASLLGVPFKMPPVMPVLSLAAARAFYWLEEDRPGLAHSLARRIFDAHFGRGEDIGRPEQIAAIASPLGIDGAALIAAVQNPRIKDRLKAETDAAIARGVFGAPFIFVDGEPFWGADRLDHVEVWLQRHP
ncbi:MAG TPA: 2-hydroxychromene-2-carboxylate isomerase [Alphaproteobacteria bacterium]|nr:2-hydroxychromene-2-carboxylate isomerase [Alphaproteobacteria bacterium]